MSNMSGPSSRKLILGGLLLFSVVVSVPIGFTDAYPSQSGGMQVETVTFLARAYIFGEYYSTSRRHRYWNLTTFYANQIEAHDDDVSSGVNPSIRDRYDIVVLTVPDSQLKSSDRDLLDQFKAGGGIVIASSEDAYSRLPELKRKYLNGELKSKQTVLMTKAESEYVIIFYPDFVAYEDAKKNAESLHQAYQFFYEMIQERPANGAKVWIVFNPFWKDVSYMDGTQLRMGGDSGIYEGQIVPPDIAFFHELVHIFTWDGMTRAGGWICINGAFSEAFANLLSYDFAVHVLNYDTASPYRLRKYGIPDRWVSNLKDYESRKIDPYSLDWGAHRSAQGYLEGMLYAVSAEYGWDTWNWFFKIARASQVPQIPTNKQGSLENLRDDEASLALNRFVYLLSLAAGTDLKPRFESWRFRIEPITAPQVTITVTRSTRTSETTSVSRQIQPVSTNELLLLVAGLGSIVVIGYGVYRRRKKKS